MTSNADLEAIALITLICVEPGASQGAGRGGATRVGDRGGEGAALLPALGEPPPGPLGSGRRRRARPARRSWDPADPGGVTCL